MAVHPPPRDIRFEDLPPELKELLAPRVARLGYLGEFFKRAAHQPEPLAHFIRWTESLKEALPFRLVEVVALTVAGQSGNSYERVQHERLALANGFTPTQVRALVEGRASNCRSLEKDEIAAAALARCIVGEHGRGCDIALLHLTRLVGESVAAGCLMLTARYLAHAAMASAWRLAPPVTSPLEGDGGA